MPPEERNALRDREAFRRQRILQEIDKSITESGLQLDKDAREMYMLRQHPRNAARSRKNCRRTLRKNASRCWKT